MKRFLQQLSPCDEKLYYFTVQKQFAIIDQSSYIERQPMTKRKKTGARLLKEARIHSLRISTPSDLPELEAQVEQARMAVRFAK
jgi:hypothetical protein